MRAIPSTRVWPNWRVPGWRTFKPRDFRKLKVGQMFQFADADQRVPDATWVFMKIKCIVDDDHINRNCVVLSAPTDEHQVGTLWGLSDYDLVRRIEPKEDEMENIFFKKLGEWK